MPMELIRRRRSSSIGRIGGRDNRISIISKYQRQLYDEYVAEKEKYKATSDNKTHNNKHKFIKASAINHFLSNLSIVLFNVFLKFKILIADAAFP